jgi:ABC-type glycerol-3-phosphate transport system substrate-binding protein
MKTLTPFQIVLLVVSGMVIIVGVIMFAFARTATNETEGSVVVWGTIPEETFKEIKDYLEGEKEIKQVIEYRPIEPALFDQVLVEALAEGKGPDVIMVTDDRLVRHKAKLLQVEYTTFTERMFKDTFIESGEIFTDEKGIFGFPFLVDPLVMYWNRSLFTEAGLSQPPKYWDELLTMTPQLTQKDSALTIARSAIAMGDYTNVNHAKQFITTLLFQAGNQIVMRNIQETSGTPPYTVILDDKLDYTVSPGQAAVNFYTQFADASRSVYTWNRSLPQSLDSFIAGDVAMYIGLASEFSTIREKNPNLSFDVAVIPQSRTGTRATYGRVLALAMPKNNQNLTRSYALIQNLTAPDVVKTISDIMYLPPVRRDLLAERPGNDAYMQTFQESALLSKNFYDLEPDETSQIFKRMIESVVTGRLSTSESVQRANTEMELLVKTNLEP